MTKIVVCPTCGTSVEASSLPSDIHLGELVSRLRCGATTGRMFLVLWRMSGRLLTREAAMDLMEMWDKTASPDALGALMKRVRRFIRRNNLPVEINTVYQIGWSMSRPAGWDWRSLPLRVEVPNAEQH